MARNDGIDRTVARNQDLETPADVAKVQEHNEREKDSYSNQDIVPERTSLNVHFKAPTDDYVKTFEQMEQDGVISTRGLKPDAVKYGELVFDVNSAYFYNHGGYEFAKQFYGAQLTSIKKIYTYWIDNKKGANRFRLFQTMYSVMSGLGTHHEDVASKEDALLLLRYVEDCLLWCFRKDVNC